jgi:hypothetical protein
VLVFAHPHPFVSLTSDNRLLSGPRLLLTHSDHTSRRN